MTDENPLPYVGPERRADWHTANNCPLAHEINQRFLDGSERMDRMEASQKETSDAVKEVLEIVSMGKGFFKSAWLIGNVIKWGVGVGIAVFAAWQAYRTGNTP